MPFTTAPAGAAGTGISSVIVLDEGSAVGTASGTAIFDFVGAGVVATYSGGTATVTVSGGTAAGSLIIQDEGTTVGTATVLNFVGAGATATFSNGTATATISGSGATLAGTAYKRTTGDYTTSSSSFADIDGTNMSFTVTTGAHRVLMGLTGAAQSGIAADIINFDFMVDGARQGGTTTGLWAEIMETANRRVNVSSTYMTAPLSAASHTFKVQWARITGSGTVSLFGDGTQGATTFWIAEQGF